MAPKGLRVGVIGAGGNTKLHHIPKLQAQEGVEVTIVANRTLESGRKVADELGIPRVAGDWREVIADPDVDAVVIGTWPNMHETLAVAALEAGKHVLCEARMATDAEAARRMAAAARRAPGLIAQVVPSPYSLPFDAAVREAVLGGRLGKLVSVEATHVTGAYAEPQGSPLTWRQDADVSGHNVMTLGILYEALARWVGHATSVVAVGSTATSVRANADGEPVGVRVPDHLDVLGRLASGGQLRMQISAVLGGRRPQMDYWIHGTEGVLHLDLLAKRLSVGRKGAADLELVSVPPVHADGWRVEEEFVGAIRGTEKVKFTDFSSGLAYMEFTSAVTKSLASAKLEPVPY